MHIKIQMELNTKFDAKAIESEIKEYIKSIDIEKLIFASDKPEKIRFIEGPPTMNGIPHAGHLRGRVIKDLWYRFNTLQGKKIEFNGGWDTQGLPVELQVEKELGVSGGKTEAIKEFGVEKIVSECKKVVEKFVVSAITPCGKTTREKQRIRPVNGSVCNCLFQ